MPSNNSSIIICGERYDVGRRVITYEDDPSISAYTMHCVSKPNVIYPWSPAKGLGTIAARYRERRLIGADRSLPRLQQVLRQFVVHHDGMGSSRDTFRVLHDERGLSVHFLIDNNGDIYQTLDLVDCGFQAAGVNEISVGVELCNRGDAQQYPEFYKGRRDKVTCTINGHQFLCFVYTQDQFDSMVALGRALARLFPALPQAIPQDATGEQLWGTLAGDPREFSGYLGHFHVTDRKWDPGPWDFKRFIHQIRGRVFFPAIPQAANHEVPEDAEKAEELAHELYDNNEKEGDGGYFPVGPMGETRLWHSGVHLRDDRGKPVVAPFPGRIVAARQKPEDDWPSIGSPNMVLIRHDMTVAGQEIKFFTFLLHLDYEKDMAKAPSWLRGAKGKTWEQTLKAGEVAVLDEPIAAGELIGHFGEAGPPGARAGQVHFEIFSGEELGAKIDPKFWALVDGGRGRFCEAPSIVGHIDYNKNGTLQHQEVQYFYQNNPIREAFRKVAVHHLSEWGDNGDFEAALQKSKDFRAWPPAKKHKVFEDQIASMFFWTDEVASAAGLPAGKMVWSYHPITFVLWIEEKTKGQVQAAKGLASAASFSGEKPPSDIKDDASDGAEGFMDDEDALFGEAAKQLTLERLADGYPD